MIVWLFVVLVVILRNALTSSSPFSPFRGRKLFQETNREVGWFQDNFVVILDTNEKKKVFKMLRSRGWEGEEEKRNGEGNGGANDEKGAEREEEKGEEEKKNFISTLPPPLTIHKAALRQKSEEGEETEREKEGERNENLLCTPSIPPFSQEGEQFRRFSMKFLKEGGGVGLVRNLSRGFFFPFFLFFFFLFFFFFFFFFKFLFIFSGLEPTNPQKSDLWVIATHTFNNNENSQQKLLSFEKGG